MDAAKFGARHLKSQTSGRLRRPRPSPDGETPKNCYEACGKRRQLTPPILMLRTCGQRENAKASSIGPPRHPETVVSQSTCCCALNNIKACAQSPRTFNMNLWRRRPAWATLPWILYGSSEFPASSSLEVRPKILQCPRASPKRGSPLHKFAAWSIKPPKRPGTVVSQSTSCFARSATQGPVARSETPPCLSQEPTHGWKKVWQDLHCPGLRTRDSIQRRPVPRRPGSLH